MLGPKEGDETGEDEGSKDERDADLVKGGTPQATLTVLLGVIETKTRVVCHTMGARKPRSMM